MRRLLEDHRVVPLVIHGLETYAAQRERATESRACRRDLPGIRSDPTGAIAELNGFFATANSNGQATDTINLFANGKYVFNFATDQFDGGTALPVIDVIDNTVTVNGNNATFFRPAGAESFRFLRAIGQVDKLNPPPGSAVGPTLILNDLTLGGANAFDYTFANRVDPGEFPVLDGGAVRLDNADLITNNVTFLRNTATDNGGAVALDARLKFFGSSQFNNTTFQENYAGKIGGAVAVLQPDTAPVIYTTFAFTNSTLDANVY